MSGDEGFREREFIYGGLRVFDNKRYVRLYLIEADAKLRQIDFEYERGLDRNVGGVYKCRFTDEGKRVRGLKGATYVRRWDVQADIIPWEAADQEAQATWKRAILEKDEKGLEIDRVMKPLREIYFGMHGRFDLAGCRAFESLVMQALRTPLRKKEQD